MMCSYGEECCCGECFASIVYNCMGGTGVWQAYFTDACFIPSCRILPYIPYGFTLFFVFRWFSFQDLLHFIIFKGKLNYLTNQILAMACTSGQALCGFLGQLPLRQASSCARVEEYCQFIFLLLIIPI